MSLESALRARIEADQPGFFSNLGEEARAAILRGLSVSDYLADRILLDSGIGGSADPKILRTAIGKEGYLRRLEGIPHLPDDPAALRRIAHREFARILLAERADSLPFPVLMEELSDLAEAILTRLVSDLLREAEARHGPTEGRFAVVALGKLGGRELNFSSDIDLLFLHGPEGEDRGFDRSERFTRIGEKIVEVLSAATPEGIVYRVDMRLRPEGAAGALVRSLDSALRYYERAGAAWERQALIKARSVAGDEELTRAFLAGIDPFIWRRTLDREAVVEIEGIQARILAQAAEGGGLRRGATSRVANVKLGPGGIREIEFLVQILQLLNGGRNPRVRATGTLRALAALEAERYLLPEHRARLAERYLFLRRVEHLLQARSFRQTHRIPSGEELDDLAGALGFAHAAAFEEAYRDATAEVRSLSEFHFRRGREISVTKTEALLLDALDEEREPALRSAAVGALGFTDAALPHLARLGRGTALDAKTSTVRRLFIRSSEVLLPRLAASAAPDEALARLALLLDRYGAKASVYETLAQHPEVADLLARIVGDSTLLTEILRDDPGGIEALLAPGAITAPPEKGSLRTRAAGYRSLGLEAASLVFLEERLRLGVRFLLGLAAPEEVGEGLAEAADLAVADPGSDIGIVAFGRWGRRRLSFFSDLDLAFFGVGKDPEAQVEAAHRFLSRSPGDPLRFDARLRPMGRNAPIVTSVARIEAYLAREAEAWERVVWRSARIPNPRPPGADRVVWARGEFLARPMSREDERRYWEVLARAQGEAHPGDPKKGRGGFLEIDFLLGFWEGRDEEIAKELDGILADLDTWQTAHQILTGASWSAPLSPPEEARIRRAFPRQAGEISEPGALMGRVREIALAVRKKA